MTRIPRQASTLLPLLAATSLLFATTAHSQAPTDAQRAAIKAQCRADYIAHCSSVPPGGAASLQCLQKNMAHLSGGCASAVNAVLAPANAETKPVPKEETKQEAQPAPAAEPAKPATETAAEPTAKPAPKSAAASAGKPSQAQLTAVRSACRSDYMAHCASIPPGGAASLQCLEKNKASLSPACGKAVAAIGGGAAAPAAAAAAPATATAAPAAAAPAPRLALRPMRPREVLFVMRSACGRDVRALCPGVSPGGGRIAECLMANAASLSPACRAVLGQFAAR